jgi:hypothetical protein
VSSGDELDASDAMVISNSLQVPNG